MFDLIVDLSEVEGTQELGQRAEALVRRGCIDGVEEALRIATSYARTDHPYKDRTGELTKSISFTRTTTLMGSDGTLEALADHASYIEDGTKPHEIWPKAGHGTTHALNPGQSRRSKSDVGTHRAALRWYEEGSGSPVFARYVRHPGNAPMPFMALAADVAREVLVAQVDRVAVDVAALIGGD